MREYKKLLAAVVGPGHSLNELTNRTVNRLLRHHRDEAWVFYPGHLGLYARHCDFYGLDKDSELFRLYKRKVRNPGETTRNHQCYLPDDFAAFKDALINDDNGLNNISFYFNIYDTEQVVEDFRGWPVFSTRLNLTDPETRHHHLMMEFSHGSTHDLYDYKHENQLAMLCSRLVKKNNSESEFFNSVDKRVQIINAGDLLRGDIGNVIDHLTRRFEFQGTINYNYDVQGALEEISLYNFFNQIAHPLLIQIKEMSWDEICKVAGDATYSKFIMKVDKYGNKTT